MQDFNEELLKEFENMQNKYVLNDQYKIEISKVKNTLNEIINNKNIIWDYVMALLSLYKII